MTKLQAEKATKFFIATLITGLVLAVLAFAVTVRLKQLGMPLDELQRGGLGAVISGGPNNAGEELPVLAREMPEFTQIEAWLNGQAETPASLKGKVVLVDFWTYSCINCIRTFPHLNAWYEKYKDDGFVIIGVHTPEFAFEKSQKNVEAALSRHGIAYPVALDNEFGTWNAYSNRYWPAKYLFDAQGRLRKTHFGEGAYEETEHSIRQLLKEAGHSAGGEVAEDASDVDFRRIGTPETYIGYGRAEYFGSVEAMAHDEIRNYSIPKTLRSNTFALLGTWRTEEERAVLTDGEGAITINYTAANVNLVMGAPTEIRAEVTLDGLPVPAERRGADVYEEDGKTYAKVGEQRLYDLIRTPGQYGTHVLKVRFEQPGAECYAFTFG